MLVTTGVVFRGTTDQWEIAACPQRKYTEDIYRVLALNGYVVLDSWQSETDGRVRVLIEAPRHALRCRSCECSQVHVHERAVWSWESSPIGLTPVDVVMWSPRVKCLGCGAIAAVEEHQPQAALVFDPALILLRHVVKLMDEKLSDLRREMYNELTDKMHCIVLNSTRWLLVMNPENLKQNEKVDERAQLQGGAEAE